MNDGLTAQTVELLQQLIRNQCVNDGTVASGQEARTTDVLRGYLEGSGLDIEVYEPDGEHEGYFQFQVYALVTYELVMNVQSEVSELMTPFQGECSSWGVLFTPQTT